MFCNNCGVQVGAEQSTCPRCGSSVIGARAAVAARTRVAAHLQLVAILWFVMAVISGVIPMLIMLAFSGTIGAILQSSRGVDPIARTVAPVIFLALAVFFAVHTVLCFLAGWSLYKLRPWGRTFGIVMAFLAIIHPPFGTALGIYTLFVLLPTAAGEEYRRMSTASEAGQGRSTAA